MKTINLGVPINSGSLVDQVIERITNAMMHKELRPGDQLPTENELTEIFHVGKSSVREAIKVLQAMGIVEVRRGEGTFIATKASGSALNPALYQLLIEPGTIQDLLELRMIYEPAYMRLAMRNATPEDLESIRQAKLTFEQLVRDGRQTGEDDLEFHRCILRSTHNPYVIHIGEMLLKLLFESVDRGSTTSPQQAVKDHNSIYEALIHGQEDELTQAVLKSFEGWVQPQK